MFMNLKNIQCVSIIFLYIIITKKSNQKRILNRLNGR